MFFKAMNNFMDNNELILTLLIFDIYSRISEVAALSLSRIERAIRKKNSIDEFPKCS